MILQFSLLRRRDLKIHNTILYHVLSKLWRNTYIRAKRNREERKYNHYWMEHVETYGNENTDKVFYVIRRRELYIGLFSYYLTCVDQVAKAIEKGYIPIIDLQNNPNMYLKKEQIGKVNAWEYYFKQPCGYSLSDISRSKLVIWGSGWVEDIFPYNDVAFLLSRNGEISKYKRIAKKYFGLSDEAQNIVKETTQLLEGKRTLGVLCRGTDYTSNKPTGHHIQPSVCQMFEKIDGVLAEYSCEQIFLGTEDEDIYNRFKEKYGERVITNRKKYIEYHGENSIGKLVTNNVVDAYQEGMDYLVTIVTLSKCNCFVGGHTSGTVGVILMNEKFDYQYIFDLGLYGES